MRQQAVGSQWQVVASGSETFPGGAAERSIVPRHVLAVDRLVYTEADYEKLDQRALVSLLLRRDDAIRSLRSDLAETKAKRRRADARLELALQTPEVEDVNKAFAIVRQGDKQKWISKPSQLAVAIRRNITNVSAADLGAILMTDVSHQSVSRYEIDAAASLQAFGKMWHAEMDRSIVSLVQDGDPQF